MKCLFCSIEYKSQAKWGEIYETKIYRYKLSKSKIKGGSRMGKKYMSISEASVYFGLSESTLYHLSAKREMPMLKYGSKVLIPMDEFDEWLQKYRCKSIKKGEHNA